MIWLIAFIVCCIIVITWDMPKTEYYESLRFKRVIIGGMFLVFCIGMPVLFAIFQDRTTISSRFPIVVCDNESADDYVTHQNYIVFASGNNTYEFRQHTARGYLNNEIQTIERIVKIPESKKRNFWLGFYGLRNYMIEYVVHRNPENTYRDFYITDTNSFKVMPKW